MTAHFKRLIFKTLDRVKLGKAHDSLHRLHSRPSRDDVLHAFRLILGREPEDEVAISAHMKAATVAELRQVFLTSEEFRGKYRAMDPKVWDHPNLNAARRTVVFFHLQKTGGTTLREILAESFPENRRCPILEDKLHVMSAAEIGRYDFFAGHIDISALRYIPRDRIDTVAMFRHPRARLISLYRFLRSHPSGDEFLGDPLIALAHEFNAEEFFERPEIRNFIAVNNQYLFAFGESFAWFEKNKHGLDRKNLEKLLLKAKRRIEALTAIGITERFAESTRLICKTLELKPAATITQKHVTDNFANLDRRFRKVEPVSVTSRLIEAMRDIVEYDDKLYEFANGELERRLQDEASKRGLN